MSINSSIKKTLPNDKNLNPDNVKWDELYNSTEYRMLVKAKRGFIIPALIFFTAYYCLLLIIQGYFPEIASKPVIGSLNVGYLHSLSQIPVAWILCYSYIRYSRKKIDSLRETVVEKAQN
ncbi:DUF485 domain-containing protein [Fictibacillus sp. B-59209]|uniref:DUF485 domain-containing protein n=1 Tax=Fictibacillus sp. B-59209 TaxID=3024873 RepID=UPI002E1CE74B|nr:DUF485 domain-containing protein [Fictibacillus sp. B-59209]